jgi:hypothetical protein
MKTLRLLVALLSICAWLPAYAKQDGVGYVDPFVGEPYDINIEEMRVVDSVRSVAAEGCPERTDLHCLFTDVLSLVVPKEFADAEQQEWTFGDLRYCAVRSGASPRMLKASGPVFTVWAGKAPSCSSKMLWQQRYLLSPTKGILMVEHRRENGRVDFLLLHSDYGFGAPRVHR